MSETPAEADLVAAEAETQAQAAVNQALRERVVLLEAELAARTGPESEAGLFDLDELFVAEGQGRCLECSCEEWRLHPHQGGPACWLCGHDRGPHKRHPDGAQAKP